MTTDNAATKLSAALRTALAEGESQRREIQVMLRRDLDPSQFDSAIREIESASGASAHVTFGIASIEAPLVSVMRLAKLEDVEWIDLGSTATIEDLMD